ncbi:NAD(P)/FAD-dependent oxidoreductase [Rhodococcus sp. HNM0569]|uniref:NAD(P)/FAD-dependent oxidoreductase n=1 Tax=Rhodococcus sp. HNM0569 TaxID=2716340 RepID=UPI001469BF7D|nr:NAD(P)/FAD-dependent oxidoreductase [Rhodococcus sp. HNM0569]NLU82555.1 NAD(P)/FAD-dependent oxidoreductase [Rhodococcus sp. HNM0569]
MSNAATDTPTVVIVGGGFAGLRATRALAKTDADVVVLDRGTSHVFQPLLYQCAAALLSEGEISSPLRHLTRRQRNVRVNLGEATHIDTTRRVLDVTRFDGTSYELPYDYLVVAAGMRSSYHGHDEFARHALGMKTLDDALAIRRKIVSAFEIAETLPTAEERKPWLTFAVAGGGPTGVELAGQIRELAGRALAHEFDAIDPDEARVLLFHGGDRVLPSFPRRLSQAAQRTLDRMGVETHLGVHVTAVDETGVGITPKSKGAKATRYDARTVLWTAGVEGVPFARRVADALGVDATRDGRVPVDTRLRAGGRVWVVGDVMAPPTDLPGVAEVAMQSGGYAGESIARLLAGDATDPAPFRYRDLGSAAYIARRNAVVQAGPVALSGFVGWLAWGAVHIAFLAGVRNRMGTVSNWAVTLASGTRRERAFTFGDPETARRPYRSYD